MVTSVCHRIVLSFGLILFPEEGGESFQIYNGRYLASTTNTIVVVTNYRIGNLGFLYAPFVSILALIHLISRQIRMSVLKIKDLL